MITATPQNQQGPQKQNQPGANAPGAALDPAAQKQAGLIRALASVGEKWKVICGGLISDSDTVSAAPDPKTFKDAAYAYLALRDGSAMTGLQSVKSILASGEAKKPYFLMLEVVETEAKVDGTQRAVIHTALEDAAKGADPQTELTNVLTAYLATSDYGKKWWKSDDAKEWVGAFSAYLANDGMLTTHAGKGTKEARKAGLLPIANLLAGGSFKAADPNAAKDAKDDKKDAKGADAALPAAPTDAQKKKFQEDAATLKKKIEAVLPKEGEVLDRFQMSQWHAKNGMLLFEIAHQPIEVRDLLFHDTAFMRRIALLGEGEKKDSNGKTMQTVFRSLDPVEALYDDLQGQETDRGGGTINNWGNDDKKLKDMLDPKRRFQAILKYLASHPGKEGQADRMRAMTHAGVASVISVLGEQQQKDLWKYATRGSLEDTIQDKLNVAVKSKNAEQTARVLLGMGGEDRAVYKAMQDDLIFRQNLCQEELRKPVDINGVQIVPYDLALQLWGQKPGAVADPGQKGPTESDPEHPDDEKKPLDAGERKTLDENVYNESVDILANDLSAADKFMASARTSDTNVKTHLEDFANKCANDKYVKLLRRAGTPPGQEFTRRFNTKTGKSIQGLVKNACKEATVLTVERILNISVDSASVGAVGAGIGLAGEKDEKAAMSLEQALRETKSGTNGGGPTVSIVIHNLAQKLRDELHSTFHVSVDNVKELWSETTLKVEPQIKTIRDLTKTNIYTIELLQNAYQEIDGPLVPAIDNNVSSDSKKNDIKFALTLTNAHIAGRQAEVGPKPDAKETAKQSAEDLYGPSAKTLFDAMMSLDRNAAENQFVAAKTLLTTYMTLRTKGQESNKRIGTEIPPDLKPVKQGDGMPTPETPDDFYRLKFGLTPHNHAVQVARSFRDVDSKKDKNYERTDGENSFRTPEKVAVSLGLAADEVAGAVKPPAEKPVVDDANKGLVRPGFTATTAEGLAKDMWKLLHEGGEIHLIQTMLYGPYNDEEQRLIRLAFRQLSGGIDWQFYIQQARSMNEQKKTPGQAHNVNDKMQTMVGGEGTEAGKAVAGGNTIIKVTADKGELDAALAVATQGELDIRDELRNAMAHNQPVSNMGDVNQIFRILDRCDDAQKKKILADQKLVADMKAKLDDNAWKRAYRVLTGQASLNDLLESRSHGDYGSFLERQFGGTDEAGMKEDIKMYVRKMRQKFEEDERKAARLKPVPPSPVEMQVAVAIKVRDACRQLAANPETNRILEDELSGPDLSGTRDLVMHQGEESNVAAVAGGDSAEAIMAEIKKMKKDERERRLKDPEYMSFLTKKLKGPDLQQAFALLQSTSDDKVQEDGGGLSPPNQGPGNERLAELKRMAAPGGDGDHDSVLQKLGELTPAEHKLLLNDPKLISFVLAKFENSPEKRKLAQRIVGYDEKNAEQTLGDKVLWPDAKGAQKCIGRTLTDEDKARLAYLKDNAISRILVGAATSWDNLLAQAVEVYKLDLRPHGVAPIATPKAEPAVSQQPDPQKPVDPALQADPNKDLYDNVEKELRNAVWAAVVGNAALKERIKDKTDGDDSVIRNAVLKAPNGDPTQARIKDRWSWLKDDSKGVEDAIEKASGDFLISTWTSVGDKSTKPNGQESLQATYKKYREAYDVAKKEPPPKQGPDDKTPPPPSAAKQAMESAKLGYMNYVIDVSNQFEQDLLVQGHAGGLGDDNKETQKDGKRDLTKSRDNPEYNKWRGMLRARIPTLPKAKIAETIGAADRPDDVALLTNPNRQMQTDREFLQDDYLQKLGTVGAGSRVAAPERAAVNDAMTNYGKEAAKAETNAEGGHGIITEEEQKKLGISKEEVERAMKEFSAARAQIASIAATLVSLVVGAAVTILTGGAGAGVAWMLVAGAISGAAGAAGAAITKSAIQGNEFDMSHEGFQMIAEGAITGLVTAGTTRMASNIMAKLAGPASSKAQATAFAELMNSPKPPAWEMILKAAGHSGGEMAIAETLNVSVEAGLAPLNPAIWVHGWDEGVINARAAVKEKLHGADKRILQSAIIGILTGGATQTVQTIKGGPKAPPPVSPTDKPVITDRLKTAQKSWLDQQGDRIGKNAEKYMHFDEIAVQAFASFAGQKLVQAAGDKPIDWSTVPGDIFNEFISAWNGLSANIHADSRKLSVERKARVDEEIKAHKDALKPAEIEHYKSLNPEVSVGDIVSVQEYLVARQGMFEAAVTNFEQQNKVQLTPKQRALFQNFCRENAKSSGEYQTLINSDPRKLNIPGFNEGGFAHQGPDASGNNTAETEKKVAKVEDKKETKPEDKKEVKPEDKKEKKPEDKKPDELKVENGGVGAVGDLFTGQSLEKSDIARIQTEIRRALPLVASLFPGMIEVVEAGLLVKVGDKVVRVVVTTMTAGEGQVARYHMTGDTATIEISDRVRDKHVERAIADMVAEIHATKEAQLGGKELPKQNALGKDGSGKEMSATDIGKLAQIKALLRQIDAAQNPQGGAKPNEVIVKQLQNDLNTLLDNLGLNGPAGAEKAKGLIGKGLEPGDVNRLVNLNEPAPEQKHGGTEVHADFIQGSDFIAQDHSTVKPEDIKKIAQEALLGSLAAGVIPDVKSVQMMGTDLVVETNTGEFFRINLAVTQLGKGMLARSFLNTDRMTHVIQFNENIAEVNIRRATAHEIAELVVLHKEMMGGAKPNMVDALAPGKMPPGAKLSGHDKGRASEMNVLGLDFKAAGANPAEQQRVRNEMFALAERLGLRGSDPDTQMRNALIDPHLTTEAKTLLAEARAVTDPSVSFQNKSAKQERLKNQMAEQEAAMKKAQDEQAKVPAGTTIEKQVGDTPLTEAQKLAKTHELEVLNTKAEQARAAKSAQVWTELMGIKKDPRGDWYQLPDKFRDIQIGGNAAVTALSPETLFFDLPGRWHVDAGTEIAQTAGQLGNMPGLGDAHDFAGANERVDLNAIRYMINEKAAKSNCVNGFARIVTIEGQVLIEVHVGAEMRRFKMPGGTTPRVSTGFPRERFLGGGDPINTIHDLRSRAQKAGITIDSALEHNYGERDVDIRAWIDWMQKKAPAPNDKKSIQDVLMDPAAKGADPDIDKKLGDNVDALKKWTKERAEHGAQDGGDAKLLQGDEANEQNYKDHPVANWTIVGAGGTSISAAEIILKQTEARNGNGPNGKPPGPVIVRMLGTTDAAALKDNTQWTELYKKFGPDGEGANKNRLLFEASAEKMKDWKIGPDGKFQVLDENGAVRSNAEGLIVSIGRDGTIPPAFSDVVYQAELEHRKVDGELLFDERDNQYLGYRINVTGKDKKVQSFDVTGATSRFLPPKYFKPELVKQVGAWNGAVEQRDAPDGAGRFGGGFTSSANQALRYRQNLERLQGKK